MNDDVLKQAIEIVKSAETQHSDSTMSNDEICEQIRLIIAQRHGDAWREASIGHYHTLSENCLFTAILAEISDEEPERVKVSCFLIEVDNEKEIVVFHSPVKEA